MAACRNCFPPGIPLSYSACLASRKVDLHCEMKFKAQQLGFMCRVAQFGNAFHTCRTEDVCCMFNSATVDLNLKYLQHEFTKDCATVLTSVFNCQVNVSSM
jgi:hypothetical protein